MGAFSRFQTAKMSGGAFNYFQEGEYLVRVASAKFDKDRRKIEFFAVSATIIESTSELASMQPGRTADWMTRSDKDPYEGNVKQFFCAVFGLQEAEVDAMPPADFEKLMENLTGPAQGCVGFDVRAVVGAPKPTANGHMFTPVRWEPAPAPAAPAQP